MLRELSYFGQSDVPIKSYYFFFFQVGEQGFLTWLALAETKSPDRATLMLTFIGPSTHQQIALVLRQSPSVGSVVTLSNYKGTQQRWLNLRRSLF